MFINLFERRSTAFHSMGRMESDLHGRRVIIEKTGKATGRPTTLINFWILELPMISMNSYSNVPPLALSQLTAVTAETYIE